MVSLYRKRSPASGKLLPAWYCFFRVPDGAGGQKQIHRATKQLTKEKAREAALSLEREALKAAGAADTQSSVILDKVRQGAELALKGRLNPAAARRIIGEIMEAGTSGEKLAEFTTRKWIAEWLGEKKSTTSRATLAAYSTATKRFVESLGPKADLHLESIASKDIQVFRDSIRKRGRTAKTANVQLKIIRACLGDAVRASAITKNPGSTVRSLVEDDSTEREPLSMEEISALVTAAPTSDWCGVILMAAYGGLRLGDAAQLKCGNLDLNRETLKFKPSKTKRSQRILEIPLHPELLSYLRLRSLPAFPSMPVFPSLCDLRVGGKSGLSSQFAEIMVKAGIARLTTRKSADGAARDMSRKSFHSLRHTATSMMANAGVSPEVRMKITGHASAATHAGYTHHEIEPMRKAVRSIPSLPKKKSRGGDQ